MKTLPLSAKRIASSVIASFLLSVAICMGRQIDRYGKLSASVLSVLGFIGVWALAFIVVFLLYLLFDRAYAGEIRRNPVKPFKIFVISFMVLTVLYFVQFLALYPGLFIYDATWQLDTYRAGMVSEHHPVLHTVLLGFLVDKFASDEWHINIGVAVYTLIQLILFALSVSYMLTYIYRKLENRVIYVISLLFAGLYTPMFLQVVTVTKDSYFLIFIILSVTLSLELAEDTERFMKNVPKVILWCLSVTLIAIFRNNCLYAVPFLLVALFFVLKKKKLNYLLMVAAAVLLYVMYKLLFVPRFVTEPVDGREFYSIPAQQLARVYHTADADISDTEKTVVEGLIKEKGLTGFCPRTADPVKTALDMEYYRAHEKEIRSLYLSLFARNPKLYFEAFLENSLGFWYPGAELTLYSDGRPGYWVIGCFPYAVMNSKLPPLVKYYDLFGQDTVFTRNPLLMLFFAPGTFFYLFLIMFVYAIEQKKTAFLPVFVFVLFLWATYLLGPMAMVRYSNYLYGIVPLYFAEIFKEKPLKTMS